MISLAADHSSRLMKKPSLPLIQQDARYRAGDDGASAGSCDLGAADSAPVHYPPGASTGRQVPHPDHGASVMTCWNAWYDPGSVTRGSIASIDLRGLSLSNPCT